MSSSDPTSGASTELAFDVTLDEVFRSNAAAQPNTPALIDPTDRLSFTEGVPRRLSYAETDAAVDHMAQQFHALDLPGQSVVAIQLPNIVESVVTLLACLRAGLLALPVPMLWRRSDLIAALGSVDVKAMVTITRLGRDHPALVVSETAAALFGLSFPCAFGADVPDGVIPLELETTLRAGGKATQTRSGATSAAAAAIATFDAAPNGFFAVGRSHDEWLAAGLAVSLEAQIRAGDIIISTLPPVSLAGLGSALMPWLITGGTLELAQDAPPVLAPRAGRRTHLVAPAQAMPVINRSDGQLFASCIAVHRSHGVRSIDRADIPCDSLVDVMVFGEAGAVALRRKDSAAPPIPLGPISGPAQNAPAPVFIETRLDADGILALRGAMVPKKPFAGALAGSPRYLADGDGFVRTGYRCRHDPGGGVIIKGNPEKIALIGGLRFGLDDLSARIAKAIGGAKVTKVEDPWLGERIRIESEHPAAAETLAAAGHSPLVIEAVEPLTMRRAAG